ncbi:MAG TPA: hypothetical protein VFO00_04375 [Vitreimonas sp.]|nr:hypothetical protein [Vitreimonas sp.]
MLLRRLVVVGLAGLLSFVANVATAEDAAGPTTSFVGASGVDFADPSEAFGNRFALDIRQGDAPRFANLVPAEPRSRAEDDNYRRYEVALIASAPRGFDVAFAQRGGLGFNANGDLERQSRSSELRLGRGLRDMPRDAPSAAPKWYFFAASEDEALIWQPGMRTEFGSSDGGFALQDRVEIGDLQAGVTYESNGWQASLAYVEREVSVQAGNRTYTEDQNFAAVTLTMRH